MTCHWGNPLVSINSVQEADHCKSYYLCWVVKFQYKKENLNVPRNKWKNFRWVECACPQYESHRFHTQDMNLWTTFAFQETTLKQHWYRTVAFFNSCRKKPYSKLFTSATNPDFNFFFLSPVKTFLTLGSLHLFIGSSKNFISIC